MLYRVPAELDFLLPSYPYDDAPQSRPWCGGITWAGLDNERRPSPSHVAWVQAVETEGDMYVSSTLNEAAKLIQLSVVQICGQPSSP